MKIMIKVKQEPSADWPDGWAVFHYADEALAQEHWEFLRSCKNTAIWKGVFVKILKDGREV